MLTTSKRLPAASLRTVAFRLGIEDSRMDTRSRPGGIDFAAKRRVLTGGGSGRVAHEGKRMRAVARIQGARDVAPVATVTERCVERLEARAIALQQSAVQRWRGCGARCADNPDAQWARVEAAR